jgi:hypothetical protein
MIISENKDLLIDEDEYDEDEDIEIGRDDKPNSEAMDQENIKGSEGEDEESSD